MDKKQNLYKNLMIILITIIVSLLISTIFVYNYTKYGPGIKLVYSGTGENTSLQKSIDSIRRILDQYYLSEMPSEEQLIKGAIKGYVDAINDKYTEYLTSSDWNEYKEDELGNYIGLGVLITGVDDGQKIVGIIKHSPAEKNELQVGDIMLKVDDIVCTKDNGDDIAKYIKNGKSGTSFKLEYKNKEEVISKTIQREMVRVIQIDSEMLEDNIGYIYVPTFDLKCANDFKENIQSLINDGAKGIIVDLRNNTGGVLTEALSMAEMLLDKDDIMLITRDKKNGEYIYKSKTDKEFDIPMVVLVNEYSASASEVLVGALKDNNRAIILGTTTYGKGVLQDVLSLSNGDSLKVTTQEFLRPSGKKIHEIGIEPDITLPLPEGYTNVKYLPEGLDNQLDKAKELLKENQ